MPPVEEIYDNYEGYGLGYDIPDGIYNDPAPAVVSPIDAANAEATAVANADYTITPTKPQVLPVATPAATPVSDTPGWVNIVKGIVDSGIKATSTTNNNATPATPTTPITPTPTTTNNGATTSIILWIVLGVVVIGGLLYLAFKKN